MANKKNKGNISKPPPKPAAPAAKEAAAEKAAPGFNPVEWFKTNPYAPGIVMFLLAFIVGLVVYKDYGICWDEPMQRGPGLLSYEYAFNGNEDLFNKATDNHGAGFEMLLVIIEKWFNITDSKAIYEMRHIVTHVLFLLGALAGYVLALRLFKDKMIASLGFVMLVLAPRLYAHSYFNSKDIPFLAMFTITLAICQAAFAQNKKWLFAILGLACGYATSIRIMGIMLACFIGLFLVIDTITAYSKKEDKPHTNILNLLFFFIGFTFTVYIAWPYLWKDPVHNFVESFSKLSHFNLWTGIMLLGGKYVSSMNLPWTYFPTWFLISNPILWLLLGFAGLVWAGIAFLSKPLHFFRNTMERNILLYLMCFTGPIAAILILHSIIYDDWRHLYFVYPSFVMLALYVVYRINQSKYRMIVMGGAALQAAILCFFMVSAHPFQQVYFNELVSHDKESLRKNYEMEYWGCAYKQGLEHLVKANPNAPVKVYSNMAQLVFNNTLMLPEQERNHVQFVDREKADYVITNFRNHSYDYPLAKVDYSINVQNSTILCIYRQETDTAKSKQAMQDEIAVLNRSLAAHPDDLYLHAEAGDAWLFYGQYDSAYTHHMRALQIRPNSLAIIDLAGEYFMKGKYPEAIEFCKKAIDLTPNDINAYINAGLCYMRLRKFDSAVTYLHHATVIDPESGGAYQNLAYTFRAMGVMDSAKKYEAMAKKITPEFKLN